MSSNLSLANGLHVQWTKHVHIYVGGQASMSKSHWSSITSLLVRNSLSIVIATDLAEGLMKVCGVELANFRRVGSRFLLVSNGREGCTDLSCLIYGSGRRRSPKSVNTLNR